MTSCHNSLNMEYEQTRDLTNLWLRIANIEYCLAHKSDRENNSQDLLIWAFEISPFTP